MINTKKVNDLTLKRITKSDGTYEDVHLLDVPNNVLEEGTSITDSVLSNINYRDDNSLEFSFSNDDVLPGIGKAIFYVKGGKLYCAINGYEPLEITSISASNLIPKKGTTYVSNGALEYFNLGSSLKLFSTRTKVGTIPNREEETSNITDATYFDFSGSNIKGYVNGKELVKFGDGLTLSNSCSTINISSDGDINLKHGNDSKIELDDGRFLIKGKSTDIGIDSTKTKFNCHTELNKASYGNKGYRLQFEDTIKLKNVNNNTNIITLNSNGVMTFSNLNIKDSYNEIKNDTQAFKITTQKDGLYISNPTFKIQMTGSSVRVRNSVDTNLFEIKSDGKIYVGEKKLNDYIDRRYLEDVIHESSGIERVYMYINSNRLYEIRFRDLNDKIITVKDSDINTLRIPLGNGYSYIVHTTGIDDDPEDEHAYLYVSKIDPNNYFTNLTIKSVHELMVY